MKTKNTIISALDIGSTKIACFIASIDSSNHIKILGKSHVVSSGFKAGTIVDVKQAENSLISAIEEAEKSAGENIDRLYVSVSAAKISSQTITAHCNLSGGTITEKDIARIIQSALEQYRQEDQELIHYFPLDFTIDGQSGIKDPIDMLGTQLSCKLHIISANSSMIMNLANCIARCRVNIEDFVLSSYASSIATLTEDEKQLGSIVIDIGGSTTSFSIFNEGNLVYAGSVPIGGMHITSDLARCLLIPTSAAERTKTLYGSVIPLSFEANKLIEVSSIHDNENHTDPVFASIGDVSEIIYCRVHEILDMIRKRIASQLSNNKLSFIKVVLTGGTSEIIGIKELVAEMFQIPTRCGIIRNIDGLDEFYSGPAFATASGIIQIAVSKALHGKHRMKSRDSDKVGFFKKLVEWF